MKVLASLFCLLAIAASFGVAQQQPQADECRFTVTGEPAHATVTGPDDLIPLVYVVEQPDSPLEIVSIDLTGMWVSIAHEKFTFHECVAYEVRNRSDRAIQRFSVGFRVNNPGGGAPGLDNGNAVTLAPGQTTGIKGCGGGGSGGAPGNYVRLVFAVDAVDFGDFAYRPSLRIPRSLGIRPVW